MKYRSEIDGLRALAVIPVILFHAGIKAFSGGFVGVDIFFVISGYLITTILLNELRTTGNISIVQFYERRARRILPALFIVVVACLPFAWLWLLPQDMKNFAQSIVAISVFASNILFWRTSGYFDAAAELKPLIHTWSLSVEEQYYVLFPPLLLAAWRFGGRRVFYLILVIAVTSLALAQYYSTRNPSFDFYLLPTRAWELMVGALVAHYYSSRDLNEHKPIIAQIFSLFGFALILYSILYFNDKTPFPGIYALAPTIGAALIIIFSGQETLVGSLLSNKLAVGLGLVSYSAYLWHQPMFAFARTRFAEGPGPAVMSILIVISFMLAYLTWRYVEIPFRNRGWLSRKKLFTLFLACGVILFMFGLVGHFTYGYESRLPLLQRDSVVFDGPKIFNSSWKPDSSCEKLLGLSIVQDEVCLTTSRAPKILFLGDSHALALYSSIYAKKQNFDAMLVAGFNCPIYPKLVYKSIPGGYNNCTAISGEGLKVVKEISSIEVVILSNYMPAVDNDSSRYSLDGRNLSDKAAFEFGTDELVDALLKQGKRVIFFIDIPHLKVDPRLCIQKLPFGGRISSDCSLSRNELRNQRASYYSEVKRLKDKFPNIAVFDPAEFFCNEHQCILEKDDKSLYIDTHHMSIYASGLILRAMAKKLAF